MNKKQMSEQDIRTKYITPTILAAGWDRDLQIREEVSFTKGKITVRRKVVKRGDQKRADYILYWKPNIPLAIVEAKDNNHNIADGMEQALNYAEILDIPFVFTSNGDGFSFYDKTAEHNVQIELALDQFPSPEDLWARYNKNYTKTKPIKLDEFEAEKAWWNARKETDCAWKVSIDEVKARGYNLDFKNPNKESDSILLSVDEIIDRLTESMHTTSNILEEIKGAMKK